MSLHERDRSLVWHPFTQHGVASEHLCVSRAQGAYLYDEHNKSYLDMVSSWWVNLHGHAHPEIAKAIYKQSLTLEHVMFAGFTHEPAVNLCEQLKEVLDPALKRFFFSDNGSTAVETALKMAYQYWWNQGQHQRTKFLCFEGAYHGDTFGAMSVGHSCGFYEPFKPLLFNVGTIPFPATWSMDDCVDAKEAHALAFLDNHLKAHHSHIAAFIAEPLVQGASGMRFCRPEFLKKVVELVRSYNILVIFDEVMTGFGRTRTLFAYEQVGCAPDLLCLAKGLSGGFLPLALTIATESIYESFLGETFTKALAHGHTYTANPLGCVAAIASLSLLRSANCMEARKMIEQVHYQCLSDLVLKHPRLKAPRINGTLAAFQFDSSDTNYINPIAALLKAKCLEAGLIVRPLGNVAYFLPPYCISEDELRGAYATLSEILIGLDTSSSLNSNQHALREEACDTIATESLEKDSVLFW